MIIDVLQPTTIEFLKELRANNTKEWFEEHKKQFKNEETHTKAFFSSVLNLLRAHDDIDAMKMFRIYRDVRFSYHRRKPHLRGGYYLHIEPGNSFIACGFWDPKPDDLLRIRKEFEMDDVYIRKILNDPDFVSTFGNLQGEEVKTAPKGFDKNHPAIDLIKKKQFYAQHSFTDEEVLSVSFLSTVDEAYKKIRPYFDYMSEVLTTDLNGVSLID